MGSIVTPELLDDELAALVRTGRYRSENEAIKHAVEVLLTANPDLMADTAIELYAAGKVTLARAAEIAGLELETLQERLAERNVPAVVDEAPGDVEAGADLIRRLRSQP